MAAGAIPTKLGTQKISSLLISYAVPGIIAMIATSLYNVVDRAFIGHIEEVGPLAISGLTVTFPLMNISAAFGTLVGVGGSTMISVLLGQKNYDVANKVLGNVVSLNVAVGLLFTILTLAFINPILTFFGASENTLPFARDYMTIIAIGNVATHLYFGLNNIIRSSGNPKLAMGLTLFTVISNAILDPVMIYGLGMGIRGAATATVICQTLATAFTLKYFLNQERFLHIPKKLVLDVRIARDSLTIGMGPFLMNLASCIVVLFINQQLLKYGGDLAIGAYGIVNGISFMFVMTVMGFNQGMQPIAGYNYGARQYSRVKEVYTLTAFWATLVTLLGFIISEFLSGPVVSIFTHDPELKKLAITGIRAMNVAFPIVGFQMVTTNLFQCLGMVHKSIFLSLSRQLLFLVPCIYILPGILGSEMGVWYSFPISDSLAAILTAILAAGLVRKLRNLKDGDDPSILGSKI
ncbi:MAG: MATE family efflux transporter [Bacteroidales bacterium]|nr:MATE family efflux transporter [Bacteroidales bacterium]